MHDSMLRGWIWMRTLPVGVIKDESGEGVISAAIAGEIPLVRGPRGCRALPRAPQVVGAHEHERGPPVARNQDPVVVLLDALGEFREVRLGVGERDRLSHSSIL